MKKEKKKKHYNNNKKKIAFHLCPVVSLRIKVRISKIMLSEVKYKVNEDKIKVYRG